MSVKTLQKVVFFILLPLALVIRLFLVQYNGWEWDIDGFANIAQGIVHGGLLNIDVRAGDSFYPPIFIYILKIIGHIYQYLSNGEFIKQGYWFLLAFKLPAILTDLGIGIVLYLIGKNYYTPKKSLAIVGVFLFSLPIIYTSSVFGENDSIPIFFLALSFYFLNRKNVIPAGVFITLGILTKIQTVIFLPLIVAYLIKINGLAKLKNFLIGAFLTFIITYLPFYINGGMYLTFTYPFFKSIDLYPQTSMNAYNIWWIFTNSFWSDKSNLLSMSNIGDFKTIIGTLSYKLIGLSLFIIAYLGTFIRLIKNKIIKFQIYEFSLLGFFISLSFFSLPTQMHERYILPIFLFLPFLFVKNNYWKIITIILNITVFLNLYIPLNIVYQDSHLTIKNLFYNTIGINNIFYITILISIVISIITVMTYYSIIKKHFKTNLIIILIIILLTFISSIIIFFKKSVYLSTVPTLNNIAELTRIKPNNNNYIFSGNLPFNNGLLISNNSAPTFQTYNFNFLEGLVGISDEATDCQTGTTFYVISDDNIIFESKTLSKYQQPEYFKIPILDYTNFTLATNNITSSGCTPAAWLDIKLLNK